MSDPSQTDLIPGAASAEGSVRPAPENGGAAAAAAQGKGAGGPQP